MDASVLQFRMAKGRFNLSLVFGLAVSVALHMTVLVPMLLMAMTASKPSQQLRSELPPDDTPVSEEEPPREEPKLGIDEGTPSSVSWVGYEEYEEHLAQLAEMDQAAFTQEPSGAMGRQDDATPVEEVIEGSEPVELLREDAIEPIDDDAGEEHATEMTEAVEAAVEDEVVAPDEAESPMITDTDVVEGELEELAEAVEERSEREDDVAEAPAEVADDFSIEEPEPAEDADDMERRETSNEVEPEDIEAETETESEAESDIDSASSESAESQPEETDRPEQPQRDAPPGEARDGEEADKDSDPTSVIDVPRENWRLGRPLAARGVEIKPERPHFTLLQMMTSSPRNPIVGIRFNNRGRPAEALILRGTGDRAIDSSIVASLYRWRAEGQAIDNLDGEQTFDIQIRIVLVQRRDAD